MNRIIMPMKAITIWQPWASLLACGAKQYETRSWETKYRGPIAIHAAAKKPSSLKEAVECILDKVREVLGVADPDYLPRGAIIATADLVNCWRIVYNPGTDIDVAKHIPVGAELDVPKHHPDFHRYIVPTEQEMLFGDWTPGRYAWELQNVVMLPEPIPAKGGQRLWNWKGVNDVCNS
ncbi:MAG: ASCH domain-containing protein [Oscillospiraceae bacterium]